jgi:hypothetical protein
MSSNQREKRIPMPNPLLDVQMDSGRKIMAVQLHVGFTYGTYTKIFNEGDRLSEINLELLWSEYPAKVLWERDFPSLLLGRYEYQSADPISLPVYKVTALFESAPLDEKVSRHSALVISWFQDDTKPLLSRENRKILKELDWEELARDFN